MSLSGGLLWRQAVGLRVGSTVGKGATSLQSSHNWQWKRDPLAALSAKEWKVVENILLTGHIGIHTVNAVLPKKHLYGDGRKQSASPAVVKPGGSTE